MSNSNFSIPPACIAVDGLAYISRPTVNGIVDDAGRIADLLTGYRLILETVLPELEQVCPLDPHPAQSLYSVAHGLGALVRELHALNSKVPRIPKLMLRGNV